jgi:hypothetical protein
LANIWFSGKIVKPFKAHIFSIFLIQKSLIQPTLLEGRKYGQSKAEPFHVEKFSFPPQ